MTVGPTIDSLFFGQAEITSDKLILATVCSTDLLLEKLISTPDLIVCAINLICYGELDVESTTTGMLLTHLPLLRNCSHLCLLD